MEEGVFPHSRSLMEEGEMEEERRLAYVGITRAEKELYLPYMQIENFIRADEHESSFPLHCGNS